MSVAPEESTRSSLSCSPPPSYPSKDSKIPVEVIKCPSTSAVDLHGFTGFMRPRMSLVESIASNAVIATLEVPGMKKADILITAHSGRLIIAGERVPPSFSDGRCHSYVDELKYGKFIRVIMLPAGIEATKISASMEDGMLTICWPRTSSVVRSEPQRVIVA